MTRMGWLSRVALRGVWLGCATGACADGVERAPTPVDPGPAAPLTACLVSDADALDFGVVRSTETAQRSFQVATCGDAPVTIEDADVPDDGDMFVVLTVLGGAGERVRLPPFELDPADTLRVDVTYRARASADDEAVERRLVLTADAAEDARALGTIVVALRAAPVTACPPEGCGTAPAEDDVREVRQGGSGEASFEETRGKISETPPLP